MTNNKEKFYLTTAIMYASRKPHFGNTYEVILADAVARYQRQMGKDVYFLTGTDEHGQKIEQAALEANMTPIPLWVAAGSQSYCYRPRAR